MNGNSALVLKIAGFVLTIITLIIGGLIYISARDREVRAECLAVSASKDSVSALEKEVTRTRQEIREDIRALSEKIDRYAETNK